MYDPWSSLGRHHASIHLELLDIAPARAAWVPRYNCLFVGRHLTRIEARCALAHEIAHIDLKHLATIDGHWTLRQEREADRVAARRLVDIVDLGEAYAANRDDPDLLAEELHVEIDVIDARFQSLHPSERHYLRARLARNEGVA